MLLRINYYFYDSMDNDYFFSHNFSGSTERNCLVMFGTVSDVEVLDEGNIVVKIMNVPDVSLVNSIRRAAMNDVRSIAITDVVIEENSTVLNSEILAHRLELVSITCKEDDNGTLPETLNLSIDVSTGPKENRCLKASDLRLESKDSFITFPETVLVRMGPNQTFKATMRTSVGTSMQHARWNVVNMCTYSRNTKMKNSYDLFIESRGLLSAPGVVRASLKALLDRFSEARQQLCVA